MLGRAESGREQRINRILALTLAVAFIMFGASILTRPGLDLDPYPDEAVSFMEAEGLLSDAHRIAHRDFVGNYLELRYAGRVPVFIDDRYDMFPVEVSQDYRAFIEVKPRALEILDDRRIDVVLWDKGHPFQTLLVVSGRWQEVHADDDWVVLRRAG